MSRTSHPFFPAVRRAGVGLAAVACALLSGCAGATGGSGDTSEAEWRALATPRPEPLDGAAGVSVGDIDFVGDFPWPALGGVPAGVGVSELVAGGLLRRRDVHFVERRRFSAVAAAERAGRPRRPGQPRAGVSPGADFSVNAVWIDMGATGAVEVRLVVPGTGTVAGATRVQLADRSPVALARAIVRGTLSVLEELDRLPDWNDPLVEGNGGVATDVSGGALSSFLQGLAREEVWDWEGARRGYQAAAAEAGFHEAASLLARAARLRLGGTLGES